MFIVYWLPKRFINILLGVLHTLPSRYFQDVSYCGLPATLTHLHIGSLVEAIDGCGINRYLYVSQFH